MTNHTVLESFLPAGELETLRSHIRARADDFEASRLGAGRSDLDVRRSRVLYHLGAQGSEFLDRVRAIVPTVVAELGLAPLPIASIQLQATSTNDGEFFRPHLDNRHPATLRRWLSFTFFVHREPRRFTGGELRIAAGQHAAERSSIAPLGNRIVLFPSGVLHEIAVVGCPSGAFDDSRLTLNGWLVR